LNPKFVTYSALYSLIFGTAFYESHTFMEIKFEFESDNNLETKYSI